MVTTLALSPSADGLGASITGVDVSQPMDPALTQAVRQALLDHHVLVFRGQSLNQETMYTFASVWGEVEQHRVLREDGSKWDAVHFMTNLDAEGNPVEKPFFQSTRYWHSDKSFLPVPALVTMLHALELPPKGGDTQFADLTRAYAALDDATKRRIDGKRAVQSLEYMRRYTGSAPPSEEDLRSAPPVSHPIVRTHPETGEKSLFVGMYCSHIEGEPEAEGRALLESLLEHATRPAFVHTHTWQPGDVLMWDNRCLLHRAVPNFEMGTYRRVMLRVVVRGAVPA